MQSRHSRRRRPAHSRAEIGEKTASQKGRGGGMRVRVGLDDVGRRALNGVVVLAGGERLRASAGRVELLALPDVGGERGVVLERPVHLLA